ncbi:carotenoid biosynthesis protein [Paenibacillus filicis]|uniref:Carotenoid biosynthesis protein n=1 Tax=Paenibacillus filicis TaxID=669464 RepID=A0ABU9DK31_9BACL
MVNKWLFPMSLLYLLWFTLSYILIGSGWLPTWHTEISRLLLILGGATALAWYTRKFGARQALLLFVICSSLSYVAEWLGVHTGQWIGTQEEGPSFAPLVFGVPLAVPFAWCMLLIIAKALAPIEAAQEARKGLTLSQKLSTGLPQLKRERRVRKRRSFWLPAIWTASMIASMELLLKPSAVQPTYGTQTAESSTWSPMLHQLPLGNYVGWWFTALLIISIINYLHDEYIEQSPVFAFSQLFVPLMLLLTLESLFLTLAIRSGLWWAVLLNLSLLAILFALRRSNAPT